MISVLKLKEFAIHFGVRVGFLLFFLTFAKLLAGVMSIHGFWPQWIVAMTAIFGAMYLGEVIGDDLVKRMYARATIPLEE